MAEKRMFSKTIIDSDLFLDMSLSTQALYFHLNMRADDDGFVNNPKKIQRMIGAGDDELKMLIAKNFIIPFDSGICVIKHWRIHNFIRNDRYKQTLYLNEFEQIELTASKDYEIKKNLGIPNANQMDTSGIPTVGEMDTQYRIDKIREDKINIDKINSSSRESSTEEELKLIMEYCQKLSFKLKKLDAIQFLEIYGLEKVKQALLTISQTVEYKNNNIKSPSAYLAATLQDLVRDKKVDVTINKAKNKFVDYEQRPNLTKEDEDKVLGWPE